MANEHLQANGQPPKMGAGATVSRASTRGRVSARARGATAMLKKRISQHKQRGLAAVVEVSVSVVHLMTRQRERQGAFTHMVAPLVALRRG